MFRESRAVIVVLVEVVSIVVVSTTVSAEPVGPLSIVSDEESSGSDGSRKATWPPGAGAAPLEEEGPVDGALRRSSGAISGGWRSCSCSSKAASGAKCCKTPGALTSIHAMKSKRTGMQPGLLVAANMKSSQSNLASSRNLVFKAL